MRNRLFQKRGCWGRGWWQVRKRESERVKEEGKSFERRRSCGWAFLQRRNSTNWASTFSQTTLDGKEKKEEEERVLGNERGTTRSFTASRRRKGGVCEIGGARPLVWQPGTSLPLWVSGDESDSNQEQDWEVDGPPGPWGIGLATERPPPTGTPWAGESGAGLVWHEPALLVPSPCNVIATQRVFSQT
ncbi:hypothetical protein PVAR5_4196 [Paecilomyces variotii No. 5]|uniref:Uncharacterized protein n=1 Tax=Byssochlamys spectabilis (strain No. 5 / NBRC 109023) TaxID=1356009 RepID=V5G3V9_BYSSN|nr:hypothetical protein PVAR5_4196 [Paecilomyces variotii No. 5]